MILLENVTKEYDLPTGKAGQLVAADRLTLEVPDGEVFGLVGPNGAELAAAAGFYISSYRAGLKTRSKRCRQDHHPQDDLRPHAPDRGANHRE